MTELYIPRAALLKAAYKSMPDKTNTSVRFKVAGHKYKGKSDYVLHEDGTTTYRLQVSNGLVDLSIWPFENRIFVNAIR